MEIRTKRFKAGHDIEKGYREEDYFMTKNWYDELLAEGFNIQMYVGARGCGKNQSGSDLLKDRFLDKKEFLYIRNTKDELAEFDSFFLQSGIADELKWSEYSIMHGWNLNKPKKRRVTLRYSTEDSDSEYQLIGHSLSLEKSFVSKGGVFDNVNLIIFDEYNVKDMSYHQKKKYLDNFMNIIETFFRRREDVLIIFYANMVEGISPIDEAFSDSPNCIKYNLYKKYGKKGILKNARGEYKKHFDGKKSTDRAEMRDYEQIDHVKTPNGNIYIYENRFSHLRFDILIRTKGHHQRIEPDRYIARAWEDIPFRFDSDNTEKIFVKNFQYIHRELSRRVRDYEIENNIERKR